MAKFTISAGATVDVLTQDELQDSLHDQWAMEQVERGRGVKHLSRIPVISGTVAGGNVAIPANPPSGCGPNQGYKWGIRRLSIDGLTTAADVVAIYKNEVMPKSRVAQFTGAAPFVTFGKGQCVLQPGDTIVCANVGALTSTGTLTVNGEATEVPAEMDWKLL